MSKYSQINTLAILVSAWQVPVWELFRTVPALPLSGPSCIPCIFLGLQERAGTNPILGEIPVENQIVARSNKKRALRILLEEPAHSISFGYEWNRLTGSHEPLPARTSSR